ncbi:MAG: signal peptidase II [Rhodobacteraceae bacterium]|nr:signal peptidase II [Paracoccaceae bacterium]
MSDSDQGASPENRQTDFIGRWIWGRFSALVLSIAALGLVLDQASKVWLLQGFDLASRGSVSVIPTIDFVLVWNYGISYGLFQQESLIGRWLLALFTIGATIALWIWAVRSNRLLTAASLALIIGGALGNGVDRVAYGAVVDFVHFSIGDFSWYVFNLADVWIVLGAAGLLYESFTPGPNSAVK